MLALALLLLAPAVGSADEPEPRVTIAMLPRGTTVEQIAKAVPGISPGVLSAGLSRVPASQTYLDIGQGTRLFTSLYGDELPPVYVTGNRVPGDLWDKVLARADSGPARIEPGLLATSLDAAGIAVRAGQLAGAAGVIGVNADGRVLRSRDCEPGDCPGVTVISTRLGPLRQIAARMSGDDMLIALERPPAKRVLLAIGVAGDGFGDGDLTSASTRRDGYVLSTDLLPTILARYGLEVPDHVAGRAIETTGGTPDAAGVAHLEDRLGQVGERRWRVLFVNLLIWLGCCAVATAAFRRRGAAAALITLAVAIAYVPALLLIGAATMPSVLVERLLVGVGAPVCALLTILLLRRRLADRAPFGAYALAALISVGATAVDIVVGSPLTALSLMGPNLSVGVRFFGIGNELESTIAALLLLGAAAGVAAIRPADPSRAMAAATVVVTVLAVLVFAPGRFGADVGAAITFPAGAAAAVIVALRLRGRQAFLVIAAPVIALAVLVAIDLLSGGDSHLSESVLGAGGIDDLKDVFERRIVLGARTFPKYLDSPFFIAALAGIALGIVFRQAHRRLAHAVSAGARRGDRRRGGHRHRHARERFRRPAADGRNGLHRRLRGPHLGGGRFRARG